MLARPTILQMLHLRLRQAPGSEPYDRRFDVFDCGGRIEIEPLAADVDACEVAFEGRFYPPRDRLTRQPPEPMKAKLFEVAVLQVGEASFGILGDTDLDWTAPDRLGEVDRMEAMRPHIVAKAPWTRVGHAGHL